MQAAKGEKLMWQRSGELVVCGQELGPWPAGPLPHLASTGQGGQVPGLGPLHIILAALQSPIPLLAN